MWVWWVIGAAALLGSIPGHVHRVVKPEGELDGIGVFDVPLYLVEAGETVVDVPHVVEPAARLEQACAQVAEHGSGVRRRGRRHAPAPQCAESGRASALHPVEVAAGPPRLMRVGRNGQAYARVESAGSPIPESLSLTREPRPGGREPERPDVGAVRIGDREAGRAVSRLRVEP